MPESRTCPFEAFSDRPLKIDTGLREAITSAYRLPETEIVPGLLDAAAVEPQKARAIHATAEKAVRGIRAKGNGGGVEGLMHEYALSSQEGIALMCLAEALLRTPDNSTRDLLIADKIAPGNWQKHLGLDRSVFVNAATWGLVVTGKLVTPVDESGLSNALSRIVARSGEPVIRAGVKMAMRMLGEQFVAGQDIAEALKNARSWEAKGFGYSYDMLGEAATTAHDAERYMAEYVGAIHAIGKASAGKGPYGGPGISIKLSALHPRYARTKYDRVMAELLPRLKELAALAKSYDIGLNIDAEEMDRLELSLDLLEALATDPAYDGWHGIGFVVQAYSKRCPFVLDWIIDLARRSGHRIMVRLVKGAYWDSEIKRAQIDGLEDFPVFTRKVHTDVSYIACAKKLLAARELVFPQFATHNAQTMATIYELAGPDFEVGSYEFQCLHGMGEPLYEQVVPKDKLSRPCRIYAPVGSHETLLAYLVRRLLENGANSSFVNQIADEDVPVDRLIADPVEIARQVSPVGAPHEQIDLPKDILAAGRRNSRGIDLSNEQILRALEKSLKAGAERAWVAKAEDATGEARSVLNPADHRDVVGEVIEPSVDQIDAIMARAQRAAPGWAATPPAERGAMLMRAAGAMESQMEIFMSLAMREAGKTAANAIAEVREAVDFLRYYGQQVKESFANDTHVPLGPVVCISPWNFPLAIFTGQMSAALVAGNPVIAKPAEETPLIAQLAVDLMHAAGVPADVLQFAPGDGKVGAALVGHGATCGVMFTGSTEVARLIQNQLAGRTLANGTPVPLVAETGGQNALVVDSSALTEQVVLDVLASAFDSAGQRCSALRVLCLQDEIADKTLEMLKGAMGQLDIGNPDRLTVDVGPVITAEARDGIDGHIKSMRDKGHAITQLDLPALAENGTYVPPTLIELDDLSELGREVFGPVLHVVRFKRKHLDGLLEKINALGYGLTFGLHTRIDTTIAEVSSKIEVGNIYVNRNQIGAVVGVQPFGGHGLSGTGPKAGGPLYLRRLVRTTSQTVWGLPARQAGPTLVTLAEWLRGNSRDDLAEVTLNYASHPAINAFSELDGPVGERNTYMTKPKGKVALSARTLTGLVHGLAAGLAAGNDMLVKASGDLGSVVRELPEDIRQRIEVVREIGPDAARAVLVEGDGETVTAISKSVAEWDGPIVTVQGASSEALERGEAVFAIDLLVDEVSTSINTAAAGGNASLMALA
ncbi:trifunctional transcriptional regulator/proline dehydrogenase/L-glutamate gamma-semialdehyde dehydrogenase [Pelagibacterium halotolerans]|uniref:Bifunctional protein PutA n=1 Tax=Pelagibacterium halotolerans (strain DSM 22347 / JCM 15775 / CGMCC 1.7692 / B2) TaxID=1082931 RepID=G4RBU0_PELHB|nr:trifunctional transcriptional regulator/proline dehydrogenase/L-glutamate gamma-semialdehyde dehydrogenase [Pelagibacterium halotolerans]AEQ50603.1 proline dehydrogenase (proline oxidase) / delta-1-pyrroline-5-carboxylate dehydrogenase [Pelagibacterium halotolerans B2]QJR19454.1 trifunctional transcriptional regulator/proline dehydrogenase/L-glutamate gamma-semialdehyde dehydrogenase [Pelagibacterium halotolerans]SDZ90848.1 L-proline dehydrogenase /delta-1-pyrroline-5-carboxylate dehydrogenas